MTRTIIQALIACALGVALGLLWDSEARAANVEAEPQERKLAEKICVRAGGGVFVCAMTHAESEFLALVTADLALAQCEWNDKAPAFRCGETRAYIRQRWGVQ